MAVYYAKITDDKALYFMWKLTGFEKTEQIQWKEYVFSLSPHTNVKIQVFAHKLHTDQISSQILSVFFF